MGMFGGYYPMKQCQGEGCTNRLWTHDPAVFCPKCRKEREAEPEVVYVDGELAAAFRELGFDEHDALLLALNGASVEVVRWRLEQGCPHELAVEIYA